MSDRRILDADMATLGRWLREGWIWWTGELAGLLPEAWRARLAAAAPQTVAVYAGDGRFALYRRGRAAGVAGPGDRRDLAAALAVPAGRALTRAVALPTMGAADLRRLVALDLDRLLPFPPGMAHVDIAIGARAPGAARTPVEVAALPASAAAEVVEAAAAAGIEPRALGLAVEPPGATPRFDFLPAIRAARGLGGSARARRNWWTLVGGLALLNLAVLIARDVQATRRLDALVAEQGQAAATARTLRQRVLAEDAARRAWLVRRAAGDPLPLIATTTRVLPDGAWLQRLGFDGTTLRLLGFAPPGVDVAALLRRAPRVATVRSTSSDVAPPAGTLRPFDLTATVGPAPAP